MSTGRMYRAIYVIKCTCQQVECTGPQMLSNVHVNMQNVPDHVCYQMYTLTGRMYQTMYVIKCTRQQVECTGPYMLSNEHVNRQNVADHVCYQMYKSTGRMQQIMYVIKCTRQQVKCRKGFERAHAITTVGRAPRKKSDFDI